MCSALLQCHFDYCCASWYLNLNARLKRKLQTTQNKIVRFITNLQPRSHIGQHELDSVSYLNVEDRIKQLCLNHTFKIRAMLSPCYLQDMFTDVSNVHTINTRNHNHNFKVPSVKGIASNCFSSQAVKYWNYLPTQLKCITGYVSFKKRIKQHLSKEANSKQDCDYVF